jgi:hypothetical protein
MRGITDILDGLLARAVGQAQSLDLRLRIAQFLLLICTATGPGSEIQLSLGIRELVKR